MLTLGSPRGRPSAAWIDRLAPSVGPAMAIALVPGVAYAIETQSPTVGVAVAATGVALVVGLVLVLRRRPAEGSWTGTRAPLPTATAAPSVVGASGGEGAAGWRVVAALGRVEARELACSPWFGIGVGFQLWFFLAFGVMYAEEDHSLWAQTIQQLVAFCHPVVGMLVVAAHAATTRARHDNTEELYASCPAGASTRVTALLSTAWVGAAAVATFLALFLVVLALHGSQTSGPAGDDAVPDLLAGVALAVGGVVLGVAVGRWARWRLAPVVAVIAVGALSLRMAADGGTWTPVRRLSTVLSVTPELFLHRAAWWYLAWLLGLTLVVAAVALAGPRRDHLRGDPGRHPAAILGGIGVAVALVGGVMTTRPLPPAVADELAARIGRPATLQSCVAAGPKVQVCGFPGYGELRDRVSSEVAPVAAALPSAAGPITLRQAYASGLEDLPPEVRRRLPDGLPRPAPGEVALSLEIIGGEVVATRFFVALTAMGLPVDPDPGSRPVVVAGQARGVVALWLAARGLSPRAATDLATATGRGTTGPEDGEPPATGDAFDRGYAWPARCDTAPVVWSLQDLAAARALLALPAAEVMTVVHHGWDRWRDPATPTDELLRAAGVAPVGPPDRFDTKDAGVC